MATGLYEGAQYVTGKAAQLTGQNLSPQQSAAVARTESAGPGDLVAGIASRLNPYNSTIQTLDRYATSVQGLNPVESTTRLAVTGEQGLGPDFRQFFERAAPTPDDLNRALAGDAESAAKFSPEEREFIPRLAMVPPERRFQIYMNWRDSRQMGPGQGMGQGSGGRY